VTPTTNSETAEANAHASHGVETRQPEVSPINVATPGKDAEKQLLPIVDESKRNDGAFRVAYTVEQQSLPVEVAIERQTTIQEGEHSGKVGCVVTRPEWDAPRTVYIGELTAFAQGEL
jgi:hypothetical protein